jgi:hypothetical protein
MREADGSQQSRYRDRANVGVISSPGCRDMIVVHAVPPEIDLRSIRHAPDDRAHGEGSS